MHVRRDRETKGNEIPKFQIETDRMKREMDCNWYHVTNNNGKEKQTNFNIERNGI